jgi:hypothetical protein
MARGVAAVQNAYSGAFIVATPGTPAAGAAAWAGAGVGAGAAAGLAGVGGGGATAA